MCHSDGEQERVYVHRLLPQPGVLHYVLHHHPAGVPGQRLRPGGAAAHLPEEVPIPGVHAEPGAVGPALRQHAALPHPLLLQQWPVVPGRLHLPHQLLRLLRQPVLQRLLHDGHVHLPLPGHRVPRAEHAAGDGVPGAPGVHRHLGLCVHLILTVPHDGPDPGPPHQQDQVLRAAQ